MIDTLTTPDERCHFFLTRFRGSSQLKPYSKPKIASSDKVLFTTSSLPVVPATWERGQYRCPVN